MMKKYNEKKFCFILCGNQERYIEECLLYLSLLKVPEGYETEVLTVMEAASMASGYNEGMNASDARYKIYLHQDTLIVERDFLIKLLEIFGQDETVGMVGMIGAPRLSKDGVMWHEKRCGDFYRLEEINRAGETGIEKLREGIREVEVVDGLLMATRVDLPWREDILKGWDFYDVSQCLEFRRAGFRIVAPAQNPSWTIHACGAPGFLHYEENRRILLQNYPEIDNNPDRLRILFFHSDMITLLGIPSGLIALGHHVDIAVFKAPLDRYGEKDKEKILELLEEGHYDLAVTYDFSQALAAACKEIGLKYLSWVYDSPLLELYTKEAGYPDNYICVFDRKQYARLKDRGFPHFFCYPLATEADCFGSVGISKKDEKAYRADIAFVGRLYGKRGYERLMEGAPEKLIEEAREIVSGTGCRYDESTGIYGKASGELLSWMKEKESKAVFQNYAIDTPYYFESMYLARKANEIERINILNCLAERFKVTLYTDKKELEEGRLKNVRIRPWVDYWKEMPKVFHLSRINLNITSRSIEDGIPQRIFDALAVGGFMLTNWQPALEEYFKEGVDLEVYRSLDELLDKADYYLKHENQRVRIAMNGYRKVLKQHSYEVRMKEVLEKTGKELLPNE